MFTMFSACFSASLQVPCNHLCFKNVQRKNACAGPRTTVPATRPTFGSSFSGKRIGVAVAFILGFMFMPSSAQAFWLLGFSGADTLPPGAVGAIAGTGGQLTRVGSPTKTSFTPFLPHAGIRVGVTDDFDVGYRLTQVALPFSSVGSSLGAEIDGKYRLTSPSSDWQVALVGGMAYSYLKISDQSKNAWSPGADVVVSRALTPTYTLISELRYVDTFIPSAPGGSGDNRLQAAGVDLGTKIRLTPQVSLIPEVGVFDFTGRLERQNANGIGMQYGAVLSFRLW
jgi:hypothetical protein